MENAHVGVPVIEDIGHVLAAALKAQFEQTSDYERFTSLAAKAARSLRQTGLAFLIPIIIMTTNLGVSSGTPIGFADNRADQVSVGDIKAFFRPEFFNRIDRVVTFDSLDRQSIEQIAQRELRLWMVSETETCA